MTNSGYEIHHFKLVVKPLIDKKIKVYFSLFTLRTQDVRVYVIIGTIYGVAIRFRIILMNFESILLFHIKPSKGE